MTGELTIDMQYVPGKVTADTPVPLHEILNIAQEYQDMHPGVEVTFEEPFKATEAMTQPTYFKAGAAAGTLPDITFMYGLSLPSSPRSRVSSSCSTISGYRSGRCNCKTM